VNANQNQNIPPHSEETEQAALYCCCSHYPAVTDLVFSLDPLDFHVPRNRDRYVLLKKLYTTRKVLDDELLFMADVKAADALGLWGDCHDLLAWHDDARMSGTVWANVDVHVNRLKEFSQRRRALDTAALLERAAGNPGNDLAGVVKNAAKMLREVRASAPSPEKVGGNGSSPAGHDPDTEADDAVLLEFLLHWQFTFRAGQKMFSEKLQADIALTALYNLSGAIAIFKRCPAYMRECGTVQKTYSLAKETFKRLGHQLWESLPERTPATIVPDDVVRQNLRSLLVHFLIRPHLFYGEGHIPINLSYARWALKVPEGKWSEFEGTPVYARRENGSTRIAVQSAFLLHSPGGLKNELENEIWGSKLLRRCCLLVENNNRSSLVIYHNGRCVRVWEIAPDVVGQATGTDIAPEGLYVDKPETEVEKEARKEAERLQFEASIGGSENGTENG
jgi:hypothetical protein